MITERYLFLDGDVEKLFSSIVIALNKLNDLEDPVLLSTSKGEKVKGSRQIEISLNDQGKPIVFDWKLARKFVLASLSRGELAPLKFIVVFKYHYLRGSRKVHLKYDRYEIHVTPEKRGILVSVRAIKTMYRTSPEILIQMIREEVSRVLGKRVRVELL